MTADLNPPSLHRPMPFPFTASRRADPRSSVSDHQASRQAAGFAHKSRAYITLACKCERAFMWLWEKWHNPSVSVGCDCRSRARRSGQRKEGSCWHTPLIFKTEQQWQLELLKKRLQQLHDMKPSRVTALSETTVQQSPDRHEDKNTPWQYVLQLLRRSWYIIKHIFISQHQLSLLIVIIVAVHLCLCRLSRSLHVRPAWPGFWVSLPTVSRCLQCGPALCADTSDQSVHFKR